MIGFTQAIHDATEKILQEYPTSFVMGLGVTYKNGADGTMGELSSKFPNRVFDTPVSEATNTGVAVGAAISGMRPIIHHGRVEFALFAADQIFTQAAKWNYMFGGDYPVPLVIRVAVGRQWGNGPQHTGGFLSLFGSTPGLRVVVPSSPNQAYQLMLSAVRDNNPVIFLEPRWLYGLSGNIEVHDSKIPLDKCRLVRSGTDLTLVSYGDGLLAAHKAAEEVSKYGIEAEVIDLVSINPLDYKGVIESLKKTQRLITVDTTSSAFSVGSEIISKVTSSNEVVLKTRPIQLACPDVPCPTAPSLTKNYYPTWPMVANSVLTLFNLPNISEEQTFEELNLAPKVECPYA